MHRVTRFPEKSSSRCNDYGPVVKDLCPVSCKVCDPFLQCSRRLVSFKSDDYISSFSGSYLSAYQGSNCVVVPGIPSEGNQYCAGDSFIIDVDIYDASGQNVIGHKIQQNTVVSAPEQFTEGFGSFTFEGEEGALFIQMHGRGLSSNIVITSGTGSFKGAFGEVSFVLEDDDDIGAYLMEWCVPKGMKFPKGRR